MKLIVVCLALISVAVSEKYTDRYDDINIEEILANTRLRTSYLKCFLDKGRCTAEGKELKLHVIDAMQSSCSKCTDVQKHMARKVVKWIRENETETWKQLTNKYDPGDKYKEIYEAFLAAEPVE